MPSQLYGKLDEDEDSDSEIVQAPQSPVGSILSEGEVGSQQAANSPYANFEDIFNKNSNYAKKAATDLEGSVRTDLGGLQGRKQNVAQLAPQSRQPIVQNQAAGISMAPVDPNQGLLQRQQSVEQALPNGQGMQPKMAAGSPQQHNASPLQPKPHQQPLTAGSIEQTLAPRGQAASLGLPGYAGNGTALLGEFGAPGGIIWGDRDPKQLTQLGGQPTGPLVSNAPGPVESQQQGLESTVTRHGEGLETSTDNGGGHFETTSNPDGTTTDTWVPSQDVTADRDRPLTEQDRWEYGQNALEEGLKESDRKIAESEKNNASKSEQETADYLKYLDADRAIESYDDDNGLALMQKDDPQASIWDAGLQAQGGGRDAFDALETQFGNYDEEYAKQVGLDRKGRGAEHKQLINERGQLASQRTGAPAQAQAPAAPGGPDMAGVPTFDDIINFGVLDTVKQTGEVTDPISAIWNSIPGAGKAPLYHATEYFEGDSGMDTSNSLVKRAINRFKQEHGEEAAKEVWSKVDASIWKQLMDGNEADARALLESLLKGGN